MHATLLNHLNLNPVVTNYHCPTHFSMYVPSLLSPYNCHNLLSYLTRRLVALPLPKGSTLNHMPLFGQHYIALSYI